MDNEHGKETQHVELKTELGRIWTTAGFHLMPDHLKSGRTGRGCGTKPGDLILVRSP